MGEKRIAATCCCSSAASPATHFLYNSLKILTEVSMVMTCGTARSVNFCCGHSNFALLSHGLSIQNWKLAILNWPFLHMIIMFLGFMFFNFLHMTTSCLISVCLVLGSRLVFPSLSVGFSFFFTWCIRGYSLLGFFIVKKCFLMCFMLKKCIE